MGGPSSDTVPEADRTEQQVARARSERVVRPAPFDASDADAFEQDLPVDADETDPGIDAERTEPLPDDFRAEPPGS